MQKIDVPKVLDYILQYLQTKPENEYNVAIYQSFKNFVDTVDVVALQTYVDSKAEKRDYKDVPDPEKEPMEFNTYLAKNNEVVYEGRYWILIKNSYVKNQLVLFSTESKVRYLSQLSYPASFELFAILLAFAENKSVYINKDEDKSIPDRLHLHIVDII